MRLFIERDLSDSWVGLPVHVKHKIGYHRVRVLGTDTTDTWCTNAYNTSGAIYAQMPTKIPPPLLSLLSVLSSSTQRRQYNPVSVLILHPRE